VNILTVDVEEWYHGNLADGRRPTAIDGPSRLERNVAALLALCAAHRARATFFVVGAVAARKPDLVRTIAAAGHDVAIHGYDHRLVHQQTPAEFARDVRRARDVVEDVTGARVRGYRAPSWSIDSATSWAYDVLERLGLEYDASVCPFRTFLYGEPRAPRFPYHPVRAGRAARILEVPLSTVRILGRNVPFSGGFYLRMLPAPVIGLGVRRVNAEGHPAIVYIHPHEIDPHEQRVPLGPRARFIQYAGVGTVLGKLERLLAGWPFTSIEAALDAGRLRACA
jgi:polysaccharide deacetylase family protein (PEP-CTERM system associated)